MYIEPGDRIMDRAFLRDKHGNEYSGEALMIALLLKAKAKRDQKSEQEVARLLGDPNG